MRKFYCFISAWLIWFICAVFFPAQTNALDLRVEGGSLESFEKEIGSGFYHQIKLQHDFCSDPLQKKYAIECKEKIKPKQQFGRQENFNAGNIQEVNKEGHKKVYKEIQTLSEKKNFLQTKEYIFHKKVRTKWRLNLQGGYFQNQKRFVPAVAINFSLHLSSGELQFSLGTLRKNYRDGFLLSHGGYNSLSVSPFWLRSAVGGMLHYRYEFFYMDASYARHLFLYNEQQIFFIGGFKFFYDLIDIYGGYSYNKKSSPLLGIEIGNRNSWFFSTIWNRYKNFHSFLKGHGENYSLQVGYYQKKYLSSTASVNFSQVEHFSFGFFRDQNQAGYLRLHLFFASLNGKFNNDYQRFSLKMGKENIATLKTRGVYFYSRYSSKSASLAGLYFTPPQEKVGVYGGFFWLLPNAGYQIVAGVGMAKIFTLEYIFMENWQKIYAPINPLAFQSSVSSEISEEVVNYFPDSLQAVVLSLEKAGFSLTLRFVFSWETMEQTLLSKNILVRLAYTKNFDMLLVQKTK